MSSLGKFIYALRPAKNMERKMFCEAFARLSRIAPLSEYRYIGLGSKEFCDFRLFHERLGIRDMLSVESREDQKLCVEFNRPYSCIEIEWGFSHDILPTLDWSKRVIVWLDYDSSIDVKKLQDVALVTACAKSGSILLVTVNSNPGESADRNAVKKRLTKLIERVGAKKVPSSVKASDLSKWGTAKVSRSIIHNEILRSLADRNGPQQVDSRIEYDQLFNFHYDDGTKMLTVGGIFLDPKDRAHLPVGEHFGDLGFFRSGDDAYEIQTPILTWREMRHLDKFLPNSDLNEPELQWLPEDQRSRYASVYRYFPDFTEVES